MKFFTLFHFLKKLLTSKHLKLFSTFLVGRNGTVWKTCFSGPQNEKRKNQLKPKTKCVTYILVTGLRVWRIILAITWWAHKRQTFILIKKKLWEFENLFFTRNQVCKHIEDLSNVHVCSNGFGKMWLSNIFIFSTRILTSNIRMNLIFFRLIYVAMSHNQFTDLDNVKMTCQTQMYSSFLQN